eukprot:880582-Pyramimonas_sp.AAC.3
MRAPKNVCDGRVQNVLEEYPPPFLHRAHLTVFLKKIHMTAGSAGGIHGLALEQEHESSAQWRRSAVQGEPTTY